MIDSDAATEYASWFKCLADPTRIKVLHAIATANSPMTVGEIVDIVGKSQSTVSRHLQVLAEGRFIFCEPEGIRTLVRINTSCMSDLPEAAAEIMATDSLSGRS